VRHALESGQEVTAATRRADPEGLRGLGVKIVQIDAEFQSLSKVAAGHDILIDAAAPYPLEPSVAGSLPWRLAVGAAVRRTQRVIEAASGNGLQLAFVSSFVTLPRPEPPLRALESAWRRSAYPYFEIKAAMEAEVLGAARHGLPVVVVNPACCLGPWEFRARERSFVSLALAGGLPVVMDQTINVIDVRDVAAAIGLALAHECFGRPIPLAGHNITVSALVTLIDALAGGRGVAPMAVDRSIALAGAFWAQAVFTALGQPAPALLQAVPLLAFDFPRSPSVEQFAIGLRVRPLEETLRDAVAFHNGRNPIG
jgi:nucleoside-diphosphate-sugar epimerase